MLASGANSIFEKKYYRGLKTPVVPSWGFMIVDEEREKALRGIFNILLKDKTRYCNSCDANRYDDSQPICCEEMDIGTTFQHTSRLIESIKRARKNMDNPYGLVKNKRSTLRQQILLPQRIYHGLNLYIRQCDLDYDKALFNSCEIHRGSEKKRSCTFCRFNQHWFMKRFPAFSLAEKS